MRPLSNKKQHGTTCITADVTQWTLKCVVVFVVVVVVVVGLIRPRWQKVVPLIRDTTCIRSCS